MDLHVTLAGRQDLSGQVYRQVRAAILDGRLRPGDLLPSVRELARRLAVSRNTVGVAYERLAAEGFLTARTGVGTRVAETARAAGRPASVGTSPLRPRQLWDDLPVPPDMSAVRPQFDFRAGIPDVRGFPFATWRSLMSRQLRPGAVGTGTRIEPTGHHALREALARHVAVSRAVRARPEDVVVTSGSQQAIGLIGQVLLAPGDVVAVEDPGYRPACMAFAACGARITGIPVDAEGMVVAALPERARLVYVCPSHHYPLGVSMSLSRRLALLDYAERNGAAVIEDDYDSEFRYGGRPLEPLQGLDEQGRVLYVGSLSKVMLPTLRLGFIIAPAPLHAALRKAKFAADWHTDAVVQAAAAEFIDSGLLARHIRRMRGVYALRHRMISAALAGDLAGQLELIPSAAGLHVAALLGPQAVPGAGDAVGQPADVMVVRRAAEAGVAVEPLSRCAVRTPARSVGLMLGYGAIEADSIVEGMRRLSDCLEPVALRFRDRPSGIAVLRPFSGRAGLPRV